MAGTAGAQPTGVSDTQPDSCSSAMPFPAKTNAM
jgi:hypothetical protein